MAILEELTSEQKDLLRKFRENLSEQLCSEHDDQYLLRFLVARNFDVALATEMLRKHLSYWNKYGLKFNRQEAYREKKSEYFFTTTLGFTNEGAVIRLLRLGQSDIKGLILSHARHEAFKLLVQLMNEDRYLQKKRTLEYGDCKDGKMVYIIDLKGLQWKILFFKPAGRYTSFILSMYEANFPECLKVAYILNAPGFFGMILNFLKKILPSEILSKIVIIKSDDTKSVLQKCMDLSILPADLGGTRTDSDGDPACSSLHPIKPGTMIPTEFYLSTVNNLEKDPTAKKTVISNQSVFSIPLTVETPYSILSWDFRTSEKDIAVALQFKKQDKATPETRIRSHKVDSHKYTESGRYICEEPGIYELIFDNTYSWFSKKELTYKVDVLSPLEEEKLGDEMRNLTIKVD